MFQVEGERSATALARTELQEGQLREKLQSMAAALRSSSNNAGAAQEQATQLQSTLTATEQERQTLEVVLSVFPDRF